MMNGSASLLRSQTRMLTCESVGPEPAGPVVSRREEAAFAMDVRVPSLEPSESPLHPKPLLTRPSSTHTFPCSFSGQACAVLVGHSHTGRSHDPQPAQGCAPPPPQTQARLALLPLRSPILMSS